jgi:hypothetical protein
MRNRFQQLAGINEIDPAPATDANTQVAPPVVAIGRDLEDQVSNFRSIQTKERLLQLLDAVVNKLDPKFKDSSAFKQAVLAFYNKYK